MDDAEDCRVCAYSDGEREHGYGSEARALTKYAESETKISQEGFKERKSPLVTVVFPSLFDAAPLHKGIHERSSFLLTILRRITMDGLFLPTHDGIHAGSTPRRNGRRDDRTGSESHNRARSDRRAVPLKNVHARNNWHAPCQAVAHRVTEG